MKPKAFLLNRISSEKQEDGYSLSAQSKNGKFYALTAGLEIIYEDSIVETASKFDKRSKFDNFIKHLDGAIKKSTEPIHLIVEKPDRLTRNFTNRERLQAYVVLGKLIIHYYKEKIIIDHNCTAAEIFTEDIQVAISKYQAGNTKREVLKGMLEKAEQGIFPSRPPLGYKNDRTGEVNSSGRKRAYIIVDPDIRNVRAVQRIFELRATTSYSYHEIAVQIKTENLLPPMRALHFTKPCVEKILKNPFYTGKFLWMGKEYQGNHPQIIPREHLRAVFNRELGRFSRRPKGSMSSFLRCGDVECKCQIIYDPKRKNNKTTGELKVFHYYHCSDGKRIHRDAGEKQVNINEVNIFDQFSLVIRNIAITEDLASAISAALKKTHDKAVAAHKQTMESYKRAIKDTEAKEDTAYQDLKSGLLLEDFYHRQIQKIRNERRHFEGLLEQSQLLITGAFYETCRIS